MGPNEHAGVSRMTEQCIDLRALESYTPEGAGPPLWKRVLKLVLWRMSLHRMFITPELCSVVAVQHDSHATILFVPETFQSAPSP